MKKTENKNENKIENKNSENKNKNKNKKIFLLRVFVLSFTILILLAWILNLKSRLKNAEDLSFAPRDESYQEFKNSLDETLKGVESGFDKVKENTKEVIENKLDEEDLDNSLVVPELEDSYYIPEVIENNQDGSANNNEEIYLPIIKESFCPEYVNCMPTIGGPARACNVPPGCENITQIVW